MRNKNLCERRSGNFAETRKWYLYCKRKYHYLDPKANVIEAWSKSNSSDNYKALITSQNKPLEMTTYQFTIQLIPEIKETGLILLYGNETARDGK